MVATQVVSSLGVYRDTGQGCPPLLSKDLISEIGEQGAGDEPSAEMHFARSSDVKTTLQT